VWHRHPASLALLEHRVSQPAADVQAEVDRRFMAVALAMGRRGLGRVAPNPSVGAVIVAPASGEVIARGWTQPGGRPHAETEALRRAGARARGATMYVTLEPCSHHGKTPPCADAVIAAGLARVVVAIEDPDPRVAGRGDERMRAAGIEVVRGVRAEEARWLARGHIVRVTERRPFVQLKLAVGRDGAVPRGRAGEPVWVTGPEARAAGHLLRAQADAILVGAGTVLDDDPELTCRLPGLEGRSPVRIVLSRAARLPENSKVVRTAHEVPVWVFTGSDAPAAATAALLQAGCRVHRVPCVEDMLWIPAVAEALAAEGITRLLVEGGPRMWAAFARAGLVDEVVLFAAGVDWRPWPPAGGTIRELVDRLTDVHLAGLPLEIEAHRPEGNDMMIVLRRAFRPVRT
jgi:diaminohydroxyphosphoribosylaminopyrimidine deaminase/5-amino-6-(5-phosphoribosylamino)uracil reductase